MKPLVIAIDGPAASGKGTLALLVAGKYGLAHLDTGSLYRAVAHGVLKNGQDPNNPAAAEAAVFEIEPEALSEEALRTAEVGRAASIVAALPEVRAALLAFQRDFAMHSAQGQAWRGSRRPRYRLGRLPGRDREALHHRQPGRARPPALAGT